VKKRILENLIMRQLGNVGGALRCEVGITAALSNVRSLYRSVQSHTEQFVVAAAGFRAL